MARRLVVWLTAICVALLGVGAPISATASPNGPVAAGVNWSSVDGITGSGVLYSVAYGNGVFVAVGANLLMTSEDGLTWTSRTPPNSNTWYWVIYDGGQFVAVANNGSDRVMTSPDGINWTTHSADAGTWLSVAYGNGLYVATSNNGSTNIMTSPDGATWTPQSVSGQLNAIVYGGGKFVIVETDGTVLTSTDGLSWTTSSSVLPSSGNSWNSVAYGNSTYLALSGGGVGSSPDRAGTSANATSWDGHTIGAVTWRKAVYGGASGSQVFVALGQSSSLYTSPDGAIWTPRAVPAGNWWGGDYDGAKHYKLFVAVGTDASGVPAIIVSRAQSPVDYDGNGSTGGSAPAGSGTTYKTLEDVTVADNGGGFTKSGYTFTGWNTAADGSGTAYQAGATFKMTDSAVKLYAQWTPSGSPSTPQTPLRGCVTKPAHVSVSGSRRLMKPICKTNIDQWVAVKLSGTAARGLTERGDVRPAVRLVCVNGKTVRAATAAPAKYGNGFRICRTGSMRIRSSHISGPLKITWYAPAKSTTPHYKTHKNYRDLLVG